MSIAEAEYVAEASWVCSITVDKVTAQGLLY